MMTQSKLETKLLRLLRNARGLHISGEELSQKLNITRSAIWKHIESLREAGYRISASPHRGYQFLGAPDRLLPDELKDALPNKLIGRQILCFESLDSTNRLALEMGAKGSPEGLTIFAEEQTKGRGRLGRSWASPKGKGLYFSILLRPLLQIHQIPKITLTAAVAICQALGEMSDLKVSIRWPNDLLVGQRKIGGILTEMNAESDRILYIVVGIGINVNSGPRQLPEGATSLKEQTRKAWDRCALAIKILEKIEGHYRKLIAGDFKELASLWESYSLISGRRISATTLVGKCEGTALGIDEDGALWIREDNGLQTKVLSGDIVHVR